MKTQHYIVLIAAGDEHHKRLVEMLKPNIGESITYIDIAPESEVRKDDEGEEATWLKVDR